MSIMLAHDVAETAWPRRTRAEELRMRLADDIVRGQLAPGAALDEIELAKRFSVSRTPVREAIRMLTSSGLVEVRAHRAAVVARPTHEQDHVAEGDHPGRGLRDVGRHAQLVDGDGGDAAGDGEGIARGD